MPVTNYVTVNGRVVSQNKDGVYSQLLRDPLGNVIATANSAGTKANDTTYWPYGEVRTGGVSATTPFGFCGTWGYYTDSTGRQYVRARYYRPTLGRWQTVDPLWPRESSFHYVDGRPIFVTDRFGLTALADIVALVGIWELLCCLHGPIMGSIIEGDYGPHEEFDKLGHCIAYCLWEKCSPSNQAANYPWASELIGVRDEKDYWANLHGINCAYNSSDFWPQKMFGESCIDCCKRAFAPDAVPRDRGIPGGDNMPVKGQAGTVEVAPGRVVFL